MAELPAKLVLCPNALATSDRCTMELNTRRFIKGSFQKRNTWGLRGGNALFGITPLYMTKRSLGGKRTRGSEVFQKKWKTQLFTAF